MLYSPEELQFKKHVTKCNQNFKDIILRSLTEYLSLEIDQSDSDPSLSVVTSPDESSEDNKNPDPYPDRTENSITSADNSNINLTQTVILNESASDQSGLGSRNRNKISRPILSELVLSYIFAQEPHAAPGVLGVSERAENRTRETQISMGVNTFFSQDYHQRLRVLAE